MGYRQILINARAFGRRITGVERYTREVTARLEVPFRLVDGAGRQGFSGHLWEQWGLPHQLHGHQILWSPGNSGPLAVTDQVLTIHDLCVIDHPEWFDPKFALWYRWLLPRLARQVKMIVTDSSYSRIRIQQVFRICENKIRLAPGGVDQGVFQPRSIAEQQRARLKYGLPKAYILFVGTLEPRKNLGTLIRAWKHIRDRIQHLHLVIAGAPGRQFQNRETGRDVHDPSICWVGRVEDADLPALYSGALLFVWPSLYEGFGLPPLEAMACGTPVVAGDATALPEVIGEAGTLVPARSEEKLAAAVLNLAENEDLRREFIRKGFERVQSFTWERTASFVQEAIEVASK